MKRVVCAAIVALAFGTSAAMACPAGTHLVGGTGAHHKGGTCSATLTSSKSHAKSHLSSSKTKAKHSVASSKTRATKSAKRKVASVKKTATTSPSA